MSTKVTKNISKGELIVNLSEIVGLANEGKSIVIERNNFITVRPAAFIQNWSLRECANWKFYYSIKK